MSNLYIVSRIQNEINKLKEEKEKLKKKERKINKKNCTDALRVFVFLN